MIKSFKALSFGSCLIGGIAIAAVILMTQQPASGTSAPKAAPAAPVKVANVQKKDLPIQIKSLGTVVPLQTVNLKSRIDSVITEVKFKDGDNVRQGDILFVLDDRNLSAQLKRVQAELTAAQTLANNSRKQYVRNQGLIKQQAISQQLFEDSKASLDAQLAAAEASKADVDAIQTQLDYTRITAPIDGRAGTINVTVGNNVKANDTISLVTINQIRPIQVQVSLPQDYFDALRTAMAAGQVPVQAARNVPNAPQVTGTFSYIDNAIDNTTGTFIGRAVFPNEQENLWPGMLVNLTLSVGKDHEALAVPEVAIQNSPSGKFVYTIKDNVARKSPVTIERIQDGLAVISKGLVETDKVIVDGMLLLKDGAPVTIADDAPQKPATSAPVKE